MVPAPQSVVTLVTRAEMMIIAVAIIAVRITKVVLRAEVVP